MRPTIIDWDGSRVPRELQDLPPGRYAVEPVDDAVPLTPEEEAGGDHPSVSAGGRGSPPGYRIYYRRGAEVFEIVRVYHQARRPIE